MRFTEGVGVILTLAVLQACSFIPPNTAPSGPLEQGQKAPIQALDPAVQARYQQALELMRSKQYTLAIEALKAITAQAPTLAGPQVNLGIAHARIGNFQDAERAFSKALELNPDHPVAHNQLGIVQRQQGRFEQAQASYQKVLAAYPDYPYAHLNMGILCDLYLHNSGCALRHYERYLQLVENRDEQVKLWVVDLKKRRADKKN